MKSFGKFEFIVENGFHSKIEILGCDRARVVHHRGTCSSSSIPPNSMRFVGGMLRRIVETQTRTTQPGTPKSKHNENSLCPSLQLGPITPGVKLVIAARSFVVARHRGLNHHFDKYLL
jgi:hypothetical protein